MVALFSLHIAQSFSCRIPRVNGKCYLKSAFGGHHNNAAFVRWDAPNGTGDICDIDGYLSIAHSYFSWDDGYDQYLEDLKKSLIEVFPRITEWKEVSFMEVCEA